MRANATAALAESQFDADERSMFWRVGAGCGASARRQPRRPFPTPGRPLKQNPRKSARLSRYTACRAGPHNSTHKRFPSPSLVCFADLLGALVDQPCITAANAR
jgi:hypothetical protein